MNTDRLRHFLGRDYEEVMHYTIVDAFANCFASNAALPVQHSAAAR
jgi:hypothetical protein